MLAFYIDGRCLCDLIRFVRLHSISAWHIHAIVFCIPPSIIISSVVFCMGSFFPSPIAFLNVRNFNINCKISHSLSVYLDVDSLDALYTRYTLDKAQWEVLATWNCVLRHKFLSHFHFYTAHGHVAYRVFMSYSCVCVAIAFLLSFVLFSLTLHLSQTPSSCMRACSFIQMKCYCVPVAITYSSQATELIRIQNVFIKLSLYFILCDSFYYAAMSVHTLWMPLKNASNSIY